MNDLIIQSSERTPSITFNISENNLTIKGRSQPEDVLGFFKPVLDWLDTYFKQVKDQVEMSFNLEYFNTSSAKIVVDILMRIKTAQQNGVDVKILWYYEEYDEDMKEAAEHLSEIVGIDLDIRPLDI